MIKLTNLTPLQTRAIKEAVMLYSSRWVNGGKLSGATWTSEALDAQYLVLALEAESDARRDKKFTKTVRTLQRKLIK